MDTNANACVLPIGHKGLHDLRAPGMGKPVGPQPDRLSQLVASVPPALTAETMSRETRIVAIVARPIAGPITMSAENVQMSSGLQRANRRMNVARVRLRATR